MGSKYAVPAACACGWRHHRLPRPDGLGVCPKCGDPLMDREQFHEWRKTHPVAKRVYRFKPGTKRGHVYRTLDERFHAKIEKLESGCWRWTAHIGSHGYGMIHTGPPRLRLIVAHQAAYELYRGPVPEGLVLDHLCRNRWCVNPDHLEPVTEQENIMRGQAPCILIHLSGCCMRGHEMVPENTYIDKNNHRYCRTCQIECHKRQRRERREAKERAKAQEVS